jgi:hypothetical protein
MTDLKSSAGSSSAALPAHQEELPQVETYRSISWGAIAVLIAAFFTPLAFLSPALWVLPLGVIVAALLVMRNLMIQFERLTGQRLVWIGLVIATVVLGWAPARYATRLNSLLTEARQVADQWAELVNHRDLEQAHQWHLTSRERAPENVTLDAFYKENADRQKSMQQFFDRGGMKTWLQIEDGRAQYVGYNKQTAFSDAEEIVLQYLITGKRKGKEIEQPMYIVVVRRKMGEGEYEYVIGNVIDYDPVPLEMN